MFLSEIPIFWAITVQLELVNEQIISKLYAVKEMGIQL